MQSDLAEFVPLFGVVDSYVSRRCNIYDEQRARWLWRMHKARLVGAGAAIFVGGRIYVHPEKFDTESLAIFREAAANLVDRTVGVSSEVA